MRRTAEFSGGSDQSVDQSLKQLPTKILLAISVIITMVYGVIKVANEIDFWNYFSSDFYTDAFLAKRDFVRYFIQNGVILLPCTDFRDSCAERKL